MHMRENSQIKYSDIFSTTFCWILGLFLLLSLDNSFKRCDACISHNLWQGRVLRYQVILLQNSLGAILGIGKFEICWVSSIGFDFKHNLCCHSKRTLLIYSLPSTIQNWSLMRFNLKYLSRFTYLCMLVGLLNFSVVNMEVTIFKTLFNTVQILIESLRMSEISSCMIMYMTAVGESKEIFQ